MRIHHLNCATMCPFGGSLLDGHGHPFRKAKLVCHCLLLETSDGLVLVDTGFGTADVLQARERLNLQFRMMSAPVLDLEETALRQIERLGFKATDVRHILLSHLDLDHAGGLGDFPHATVHVLAAEHAAATARDGLVAKQRYVPAQWAHGPKWKLHEPHGEPWFGFQSVRQIEGLPPEILMIPLRGHSLGHSAIAVDHGAGWLLYAGDAYFFHGELEPSPRCPPALRVMQRLFEVDRAARLENQARLRALARQQEGQVEISCAHDPVELDRALAAQGRAEVRSAAS